MSTAPAVTTPRFVPDPATLPAALTGREQWVCWKSIPDREHPEKKPKKLPIDAATGRAAKSTDPVTWGSVDEVFGVARRNRGLAGVGFVFSAEDPLAGIDRDNCRDPETGEIVADWRSYHERLLTVAYAEVSPSGTGVKYWLIGSIPDALKRDQAGIEIYDQGRYFTVTGMRVDGCQDEPQDGQVILDELLTTFAPLAPAVELPASPPPVAPVAPAIAPLPATGWRADRAKVVEERLAHWVQDCLDWARREMATAPEGDRHNRRLRLGKFLGGVIASAPAHLTPERALSELYGAQVPESHHSQELRAIRDGLSTGMGLPLTPGAVGEKDGRDYLPTDDDMVVQGGRACCPRCETAIRRSRYDYGDGLAPGWYCPTCKWPMVWPLSAWAGGEVAQVATGPVAVPVTAGADAPRELPLLLPRRRLKELPPAVPLIPDILFVNMLHLWFGEPENGKSLLVIGLAAVVAQVYPVIYVAAEAVEDYEARLTAWEELHHVSADNIYFWRMPIRFAVPGEVERFIAAIIAIRPALVVIDPLASCMSGLVEGTQEGMQVAIDAMNAIRMATGAAVLPIHHTGWDTTRARGSSTLPAAARNMAKVERLESGEFRLSCAKRNQGPRWPPRLFRLVEIAESVVLMPAHLVTAPSEDALTERGLKVLRALTQEGMQKASHNQIVDYTGYPKSSVYELLTALKRGGYIAREEKGNVKTYRLTREGEIAVEEAEEAERTGSAVIRAKGRPRAGRFAWDVCPPEVTGLAAVGAIDPDAPATLPPSGYAELEGYDESPIEDEDEHEPWAGDGGAEPEPEPGPSAAQGLAERLMARKEGASDRRAAAD